MMLPTQSAGAGRFADFDLYRVPSPCFVIDEVKLSENLGILKTLGMAANANILLALKAFSMWELAPLISKYLDGCCASGLWEAKLAQNRFGGHVSTYSPAFKPNEIDEIATLSSHVIVNTPQQAVRFGAQIAAGNAELGLRVNPMHSEGEVAKYDPCAPGSRLGTPLRQLENKLPEAVQGLHIHTLCEQGFPPLARTVDALHPFLEAVAQQLRWLNLGGGHLVTHHDYERAALAELINALAHRYDMRVFLELGTAVAFDAGILVGEVLDLLDNEGPVAVLDVSATCHMPDVLEAPYRPALRDELAGGQAVRLGGPSCLAGDVIGTYGFDALPQVGDRLAFLDQAHYSMVKTTTFNGVPLPALAIWNSDTDAVRMVRAFGYADFEGRLS